MSHTLLRYTLRNDRTFFKTAKKFFSKHFLLYLKKSPDKQVHVAVIVPKKTVLLATQRNYVKRKLKAVVSQATLPYPDLILIIVPKKTVITAKLTELKADLERTISGI